MTTTDKDIILVPDAKKDPEWAEIVNKLVDDLGDELPDQVVQATELLLCGWPTYQVAKKVNASTKTVRAWLEKYPSMAMAVKTGREMLTTWRMSKLEQQFILALGRSEEILELTPESKGVDARLTGVIAQHARYIIGLYVGQKVDVNIHMPETPQMKARNDALDYIATQMKAGDQIVDGTYTVVAAEKPKPPLLDEAGNPHYGQFGVLDRNDEGILCHICGHRFKTPLHVVGHNMKLTDYCLVFMVSEEEIRQMPKDADVPNS